MPRTEIFCARDRADETVDVIRGLRTPQYKYIRNYYTHRPQAQSNQYKDEKGVMVEIRRLNQSGRLTPQQASLFNPERPAEELYNLADDPYELHNLAASPRHQRVLADLRKRSIGWEDRTRDMGLLPEPILEDLGLKYGNKYFIMQQPGYPETVARIRQVVHWAENGSVNEAGLLKALADPQPAVRYWAATGLGSLKKTASPSPAALENSLNDPNGSARIAAALALLKKGREDRALPVLADVMKSQNALERLYAILALEESGSKAPLVGQIAKAAQGDPYEYVRRVAERMSGQFVN